VDLRHTADTEQQEQTQPASVDKQAILQRNLAHIAADARHYYDAEKDKQDIERYYTGVRFGQISGQELFGALHKLLESTHEPRISYSHSDEKLKTWVDLHPDQTFRSLYSRKEADPAAVIEQESLLVHEAGAESVDGKTLNIEHVVPQSWFSDNHQPSHSKEPMRGDLHHLFYCEKGCNEFRGNKAYHDFAQYHPEAVRTEQIRNECGMGLSGDNGTFEPEYGKGLVARATLYFLLRYPDKIEAQFRSKLDVELLLNWHKQFPPDSVYEKHRNQAIFEIQGNRNPLIDFPQYAGQIDFGAFRMPH
jgi:deoxyribonuclease I